MEKFSAKARGGGTRHGLGCVNVKKVNDPPDKMGPVWEICTGGRIQIHYTYISPFAHKMTRFILFEIIHGLRMTK